MSLLELGAGLQAEEMADVGSDAETRILSCMSFSPLPQLKLLLRACSPRITEAPCG